VSKFSLLTRKLRTGTILCLALHSKDSSLLLKRIIEVLTIKILLLSKELDVKSFIGICTFEPIESLILLFSAGFSLKYTISEVKTNSYFIGDVTIIRPFKRYVT
jgi:hypothetical protein